MCSFGFSTHCLDAQQGAGVADCSSMSAQVATPPPIRYAGEFSSLFSFPHTSQERSSVASKKYQNLIGGRWVPARGGKTFLNVNPANHDDVVGEFALSGAEDVA